MKAYQVVGERIDGGVDILEESDDQKQAWLDFAWHSKEELIAKVRGVSADYNRPLTDDELSKKGDKWLRKVYSSMVATNDLCPNCYEEERNHRR